MQIFRPPNLQGVVRTTGRGWREGHEYDFVICFRLWRCAENFHVLYDVQSKPRTPAHATWINKMAVIRTDIRLLRLIWKLELLEQNTGIHRQVYL
jgi:hypothetical protein